MKTGPAGDIGLMSRDEEMGRIILGLQSPEPAAFVLAGPEGVGKTRLAAEIARSAPKLGFVAVRAGASRTASAIPFGPFARFLPEAGLAPGDLTGLLRQAGEAMMALAGDGRRLLLVVDDAQFLDAGSAALVHQLALEKTCSLLVSLRMPGAAPDLVTALWKDGLAERIELSAWAEAETTAVVSAFLGGPVAGETVRRLWEVSEGNALYLRELLIGAVGSESLTESAGIWALHRPLAPAGRLIELVAARLAGLPHETVTVVETLAVGEPLGIAVVETITSLEGLEDAEAQGLVRIEQDGRRTVARLSHPVYGEVLRQSMPRSRLRRLSAALAESMGTSGARRRDDLLRLGRWQLDSGRPGEPALLSRAARRASEVFDLRLAERLAQAAMDAGGTPEAGLVLGETRFRSGQYTEAESVLAETAALCRTDGEVARIASARAYNLYTNLGDAGAAAAVLDQALMIITATAPHFELLGRLAMIKLFELDLSGAVVSAQPLLASDDSAVVSRGSYVSSIALALTGRTEDALAIAYAGLEAHRRATGHPQLPEAQPIGAFFGHLGAGQRAAEAGLRVGEARLRHDIARLGHPGQAAPRLAELAAEVDGELVPALAAHAAALVSGKASEIDAAGQRLESLGAALLAAEAFLAAAASYRSDGLARPAAAATSRAAALIARCGDVQTPGLTSDALAARLTARELEIATMAAAGIASREIAARLVLSVRTVDNHLQNVYAKLGLTSRDELGQVLGRPTPAARPPDDSQGAALRSGRANLDG